MEPATPSHRHCVGIDIAATTFTALWSAEHPARTFTQSPDGFAALLHQLHTSSMTPAATLVVMEATGLYWVALATTLYHAGYQVAVLNPKQIYNFAHSLTRRSKTDALDAQVLWRFALERQPARWTPPPAVYHELRQRLTARDALVEMRQQVRNQQHALHQWPIVVSAVRDHFSALEADLDARIAALDTEIATVQAEGAWAESAALLRTIPGIGPATTAWLLVATLNFELCPSPTAAAAYVGLAPIAHESGTSVYRRARVGRGGHRRLRQALYIASISAARHNPQIRAFYDRLVARGKSKKVAHCAAARKLLHLAWAVVTKRQPFEPQYGAGSRR